MSLSYRLLELNIMSAQDLPPVSKMLRTFVVAYVNPDNKLTTRVDHHGHTNPTWNYKLVFRVDDHFLRSEASAVTIEVYNVAWLRDLPVGTTRLVISHISPPLEHKNYPAPRFVVLHLRRPSGHLQGILNVGVNLVGDHHCSIPSSPPDNCDNQSSSIISTISEPEILLYDQPGRKDEKFEGDNKIQIQRSKSNRIIQSPDEYTSISPIPESIIWSQSEADEKSKVVVSSNNSLFSAIRPLPSEVASDLKKGCYSTSSNEIGSSIFDNWTVPGPKENTLKSISVHKQVDEQINLLAKDSDQKQRSRRRRHSSEGKGLMSCFGNAYGFQFTFFCGSKSNKKSKKKKHDRRTIHSSHTDENLREFHI